jgi:allantoate deiminase
VRGPARVEPDGDHSPRAAGERLGHPAAAGAVYMRMHSGAAHDTMCIADRVPTAMVFVPRKDGIGHHPAEDASPADAALAAEIILNPIQALAPG